MTDTDDRPSIAELQRFYERDTHSPQCSWRSLRLRWSYKGLLTHT